ncbi:hypothetical protein D3C78_1735640 [compost metagenome]
MIGLYRISAFVLQCISADFIQQTDIATFLTMVEQDTATFFCDMLQRSFQLKTAVAAQAE